MSSWPAWLLNGDIGSPKWQFIFSFFCKVSQERSHFQGGYVIIRWHEGIRTLNNFDTDSSLKLSFTNIWGICSNFVVCELFLESNSPDILAPCEQTWIIQLNLEISLWEVMFLWFGMIVLFIFIVLHFLLRRTSFSFSMFLTDFTLLSVLFSSSK